MPTNFAELCPVFQSFHKCCIKSVIGTSILTNGYLCLMDTCSNHLHPTTFAGKCRAFRRVFLLAMCIGHSDVRFQLPRCLFALSLEQFCTTGCSEACERLAPVLGSTAVVGAQETSSSGHCIIGCHSVIQTVQKHNSTRGPQARPQQQLQLFRAGRPPVHDCFQSRG